MRWLRFFRRRQWDVERAREIEGYLEHEIADNMAHGMSAAQARRAATRKLGNTTLIREEIYRMNSIAFIESLQRDLRHAFRVLWKNPGFTLAVTVVLALGIGANTAIFSIVNAVLLRPLPFKDSSRLVRLFHSPPQKSFPGVKLFSVSPANYLDWKRENRVFENMAVYRVTRLTLTGGDRAEALTVGQVASDFFPMVGTPPAQGRIFTADESEPGHGNVAIVGDSFWKTHLASSAGVLGRTLMLNRRPYTIVGVMPPSFELKSWGVTSAQIWTPLVWDSAERAIRAIHNYNVVARLKPGVSLSAAMSDVQVVSRRLATQYPNENEGWGCTGVPLQESIVGNVSASLWVLLGAVAFVLLIAASNVANLVLARTLGRRKEMAVRVSLGASRAQVLQQVLVETVLLSVTGGLVGLLLARATIAFAGAALENLLPLGAPIEMDAKVLAFTLAIAILTGICAGLIPALQASGKELNDSLKQGLGRTDSTATGGTARGLLVVSEVALSFILLMGSVLMIRSLWALHRVSPGFDPHHVLTLSLAIPQTKYSTPDRQSAFFDEVLRHARALPGVEAAAFIDNLPLTGGSMQPFTIEGRAAVPASEEPVVAVRESSPGYLRAMRIPLLAGRDFREADKSAVLVAESMAKTYWPNESPLGRRLRFDFTPGVSFEVVGIVGDVKQRGLSDAEPRLTVYQWSNPRPWTNLSIVVRTTSDASALSHAIAGVIHDIDREQPVQDVRTMDEVIESTLTTERFNMILLSAFAGIAVLLAAVGIYSVLSYGVRRRTREIGIRTALGAGIGDVVRTVLLEGMKPALTGIVIGLLGAVSLGRVAGKLIYGVKPTDPATLIATALFFATVALLAGVLPAYRAGRVDPLQALREE